jgi:putative endonuclease
MTRGQRNRSIGAYGERVAAQHLVASGMVLVDRNWRCGAGEIDLVLRDGDVLVFCEVKTRSGSAYGHPLEAVGPDKAARLRRLAGSWLHEHEVHARGVRVDIVGVLLGRSGAPEVSHLKGVG